MKLENLKISINIKDCGGNNVEQTVSMNGRVVHGPVPPLPFTYITGTGKEFNINFELGSYEVSPEEHDLECKLAEKLLPALNTVMSNLAEVMNKKK